MKKSFFAILFLSATFIGITSFNTKSGNEPGNYAHNFKFVSKTDSTSLSTVLSTTEAEYILINFWSSSDAASRLKGKNYQISLNQWDMMDKVTYFSINLDQNIKLGNEIAMIDHLDSLTLARSETKIENVRNLYGMKHHLKSFLLNDKGEIVSVNPLPEEINRFINKR